MAFRRKHNPLAGGGGDGHGELMITPLLDLFVALIPFLIMSAVMVKINVADVAVSKPVAVVTKTQKRFNLHLKVSTNSVSLLLNKRLQEKFAIDEEGQWKEKLHNRLVAIKKSNLDQMEIRIEPTSDKVELDSLMAVMDSARSLKKSDGEIHRIDAATQQKVKLKFLFPKVILRGVYG